MCRPTVYAMALTARAESAADGSACTRTSPKVVSEVAFHEPARAPVKGLAGGPDYVVHRCRDRATLGQPVCAPTRDSWLASIRHDHRVRSLRDHACQPPVSRVA